MAFAMALNDRAARRVKLKDLRILLAVAQRGSMGKAATELAISQPAISKAIADLEHTLGVQLLDRTALGVEPTLFGNALVKWSTAVFDDLRQGVNEIEFLSDPTVGELRIGATEPLVAGLLPVVIARLARQHPRLVFHITQMPTAPLFRELSERKVDVIVGRLPDHVPEPNLDIEPLFNDPQFVVAGQSNAWTRRRNIKLGDLIDEPWTLPRPDSAAGALVADTFRACGLDLPPSRVICNSIQMHSGLLADGAFLAMYPRSLLRFGAKRLAIKVLAVDLPKRTSPVGIVTLKNRTVSPVAQLFIEAVRAVSKPLALRPH
jgi:DNA-binding transcriptional LysR family regulator